MRCEPLARKMPPVLSPARFPATVELVTVTSPSTTMPPPVPPYLSVAWLPMIAEFVMLLPLPTLNPPPENPVLLRVTSESLSERWLAEIPAAPSKNPLRLSEITERLTVSATLELPATPVEIPCPAASWPTLALCRLTVESARVKSIALLSYETAVMPANLFRSIVDFVTCTATELVSCDSTRMPSLFASGVPPFRLTVESSTVRLRTLVPLDSAAMPGPVLPLRVQRLSPSVREPSPSERAATPAPGAPVTVNASIATVLMSPEPTSDAREPTIVLVRDWTPKPSVHPPD